MAHAPAHGHLHHRTGPAAVQESTFHVHKTSMYVKTVVALIILMALTVILAQVPFPDVNFGLFTLHGTMINNLIAMAIATAKALLVINFFMGIRYATKLSRLWALAGFAGFALMFLMYGDYATRKYEPTPRWSGDPGSAMQRSVHESRESEDFRKLEGNRGF